jgi:hypothetical protein
MEQQPNRGVDPAECQHFHIVSQRGSCGPADATMYRHMRGESMKLIGKTKMAAAAALLASAVLSSAAFAAPASPAATQGVSKATSGQVQEVRGFRGWGHNGGWRGHQHGFGRGFGFGAAAAGLLLTAPYWGGGYGYGYGPYDDDYYSGQRYAYGGGVDRCEATFRSFDPGSGTYMGYDGARHRCPYL